MLNVIFARMENQAVSISVSLFRNFLLKANQLENICFIIIRLFGFSNLGTLGKKKNLVSDIFLLVFCSLKYVEIRSLGMMVVYRSHRNYSLSGILEQETTKKNWP